MQSFRSESKSADIWNSRSTNSKYQNINDYFLENGCYSSSPGYEQVIFAEIKYVIE